MGLFEQFIGGAPPSDEDRRKVGDVPAVAAPVETSRAAAAPERSGLFEQFVGGPKFPGPTAPVDQFSPAKFNRPFGELKPADVTPTQQLKWNAIEGMTKGGVAPHVARHMTEAGFNIAGFTPMGSVLSVADLPYNVARGNYGAAAFDALGAAPLLGYGRAAVRGLPTRRMAETPSVGELEQSARGHYRFSERSPLEYHPDAISNYADRARAYLQSPHHGRGVFTPEGAPELYATLERFQRAFPRGGNRPISATDLDTLRQSLRGLPGASGPGGRQAVDVLDTFTVRPPQGMLTRGTPQDIANLQQSLLGARGDWRAAKTTEGVQDAIDYAVQKAAGEHSGKNIGNRIRQGMNQFVTSDAGQARLFGATADELRQIADAAAGSRWTNALRAGSNRLGGGGGWGQTNTAVTSGALSGGLAHWMGLDPVMSAGVALTGGMIPGLAGGALRRSANEATERAAREASENIARNSPLFRAREATDPPVTDPRAMRDLIAASLIAPVVRETGTEQWNRSFVPYENRQ